MTSTKRGYLSGIAAYLCWGLFPLYWGLLRPATSLEMLAHRVVWSLVFLVGVIAIVRGWRQFRAIVRPRTLALLALAAVLVAGNWATYIYGVIAGIATLYGVVLARRFGAPAVIKGERLPRPVAAAVGVVFGLVLGASAAIGVALGWTEPYWVPEPVLILVLYILMGKRDRIRGKAIGTALGVVAAIPVAIIAPSSAVLAAVGTIAFVLALTQAKTYWLMYGLYTFSLVVFLAAPGQVGFEAEERGFQILVGIGLLVVGLVIVHALGGWLAKRDPQPELAPAR